MQCEGLLDATGCAAYELCKCARTKVQPSDTCLSPLLLTKHTNPSGFVDQVDCCLNL